MKRVFSKTSEVATAWANMTHDDAEGARTSSNTWSRHRELFSYGTPIASIQRVGFNGRQVALISVRQFSSGTSKVQGEAYGAAHTAGHPVFKVAKVSGADMHAANMDDYERRVGELLSKIQCAVTWPSGHRYRQEAMALIGEAHLYAVTFGLGWSYLGANPSGLRSRVEMKEAA